ncbi:MAG: ERF family protein [Ralstonia sp.]
MSVALNETIVASAVVVAPGQTAVVGAQNLFSAIVRATEAGLDPDKAERMFALWERVKASEAKAAWIAAMSAAQPELPAIVKHGKNKGTNSSYALWEDVNRNIVPILAKHGLTLTFRTSVSDKMANVTAVVSHVAGHAEETTVPQPIEVVNRAMNNNQAVASAISYGKRAAGGAILNLTYIGEDDDGNKAASGGRISADDAQALRDKMAACGLSEERFCTRLNVSAVDDLPASRYDEAERRIMDFARAKGGQNAS